MTTSSSSTTITTTTTTIATTTAVVKVEVDRFKILYVSQVTPAVVMLPLLFIISNNIDDKTSYL